MQILRRAVTLEEKKGKRAGRRLHERTWKSVASIAGSMIERAKSEEEKTLLLSQA